MDISAAVNSEQLNTIRNLTKGKAVYGYSITSNTYRCNSHGLIRIHLRSTGAVTKPFLITASPTYCRAPFHVQPLMTVLKEELLNHLILQG